MNGKRILGIILVIGGIVLLAISSNILSQVGEGKDQIASGQKKLNQANSLFSLHPVAEEVGKGVTSKGQKKIDAAQKEVGYYESLADQLKMGGIALIVVGGLVFILGRGKKRK